MPSNSSPGPDADNVGVPGPSAGTPSAGTPSTGGDPGPRLRMRALRGATTVDEDTIEQVTQRTQALLAAMVARNGVDHAKVISVLFTATDDIHSMFPATAARAAGFGDVPLLCARELDINGAQPRCIRVMMHLETPNEQLHHIYLEGARGLRDDLPE
jgi:chorismate mutase